MCSHLNPGDQPSLEDVRACIEKNKIKNNEPSRNQATALEPMIEGLQPVQHRTTINQLSENDVTAARTFV